MVDWLEGGLSAIKQVGQVGDNLKLDEQECIGLNDIRVGENLKILSVDFFVYDCDDYTRQHMKEKYGVTLAPRIDVNLIFYQFQV